MQPPRVYQSRPPEDDLIDYHQAVEEHEEDEESLVGWPGSAAVELDYEPLQQLAALSARAAAAALE
jgi:hypothetical protein